ncbi:CAP domain-containing protein [Oceanobacillus luteolus]|uniref:CAP domain-containing protein n=1 Tax=Oceanobacillus luteolus TaxID=1274358 RepID=A0ABW4HS04_9BACI|nr:CAP domain-containing protein [Oceanobacillus luteolus]
MRILRSLILLTLVAIIVFYWMEPNEQTTQSSGKHDVVEKSLMLKSKSSPTFSASKEVRDGNLYSWVGMSEDELLNEMGEPNRKDLSAYNYVWWVYTDGEEKYIQFGMEDGVIRTVYATGTEMPVEPLQIGQTYDFIIKEYPFEEEVTYTDGLASYMFRMTDEDILRRPLVKLSDDLFMQLYFDTFTKELSSIRIMDAEVLLRHQPYEVVYRGSLPQKEELTEEDWRKVERGMEQQIFDISNVIRNRFGKAPLEWEEEVSEVAFLHSKDMSDHDYFSHYSLNGDGLKERLGVSGVFYISAGENIAAQYPDAASAVEGWLNSDGHREALLAEEYTHLGVGVYRLYYTQNFLAKPM